jgi:hypothetical protein
MKRILCALCLSFVFTLSALLTPSAQAATPQFSNLSQDDFDDIVRELSANGMFHSVTPASSMASIIGLEVGVIGGITKTPDIDRLVKRAGGSDGLDKFPHAGLLGVISTPFAFTGEVVLIPKLAAQGVDFSTAGAAVKWVPTDRALPLFPLNVAIRAFYTQTTVSYSQTVTDVNTSSTSYSDIDFTGKVMGAQILVSPKLIPILEPYVGLGALKADGRMNISGSNSFFNFTTSQSAKSSPSTTQLLAGLDVRLILLGFGVEYSRAFETETFTGKFSFKF